MPRVFSCLAIGLLLVVFGSVALGLGASHFGPDRHVALALFTLVLSCGVQATAFIYLAVVGRMIAQAVHLGGFDTAPIHEAKRLKANWTRWMAIVVVSIVFVTATGAVRWRGGAVGLHQLAVLCFVVVHMYVLYWQYLVIVREATLVARALEAYTERKRRGSNTSSAPDER